MPTREELDQADAALQRAGYSDDERLMVLDQLIGDDPNLPLPLRRGGSSEMEMLKGAAQTIIPMAGAVAGGAAAPGLAARYLPNVAKYVPRPVWSGIGQGIGDFAGSMITGTPPFEAAKRGATTGLVGGGVEGAFNVGSRLLGRATSMGDETVAQTLQKPVMTVGRKGIDSPAMRVMFKKPSLRPTGLDLIQRMEKATGDLSPGRIAKVSDLEAAEKAGVRVNLKTLGDAIDTARFKNPLTDGQIKANAELEKFRERLFRQYGHRIDTRGGYGSGATPTPGSQRMTLPEGGVEPGRTQAITVEEPGTRTVHYTTGKQGVRNVNYAEGTSAVPEQTGGYTDEIGSRTFPRTYETRGTIDAPRTYETREPGKTRITSRVRVPARQPTQTYELNTVSPTEADEVLRGGQSFIKNAYTTENPSETVEAFRKLNRGFRESFYNQVDTQMPGASVRESSAASKRYLDSVETLEHFVKDEKPESFVRKLFDRRNESELAALREFEKHIGSGGELENTIKNLALKEDWTKVDKQHVLDVFRWFERLVTKPVLKTAVLATRPAGQAAAAGAAFYSAMDPRNNP